MNVISSSLAMSGPSTNQAKCPGCNIQDFKSVATVFSVHFSSPAKLTVSAGQGCKICSLILQGIEVVFGKQDGFCMIQYGVDVTGSTAMEASIFAGSEETVSFFRSPGNQISVTQLRVAC